MTCREEILEVIQGLEQLRADRTFTVTEVLEGMHRRQTRYLDNTIRSCVISKMCREAPAFHGTQYHDLERVAPNRYRLARTDLGVDGSSSSTA